MKIIILAGGKGTRLWPLSRSHFPKQFLKIGSEDSFLQKTVKRMLKLVPPQDLFIVTGSDYFSPIQKQICEINPLLEDQLIVEPEPKNTAPAIVFSLKFLMERGCGPDELVLVSPADHVIAPDEDFCKKVMEGVDSIQKSGRIITFGVRPYRPETGFGYIKAENGKVTQFTEKPTLEKAQEYVASGKYFWNAGLFLFTIGEMKRQVSLHAPSLVPLLEEATPFAYSQIPSISIDYAIMEKSADISMVPLDLTWSDIGCWDNVYDFLEKDATGNVMMGNVEAHETTRSLVFSTKRLVSTIGLDQMIVIETEDVVLVARLEESQKVREVVERLKQKGCKEIVEHATIERPWGSYTVLEEGHRYKIKRIEVKPKQKLSLQLHYHRSEHWVVVTGTAKVTIGDQEKIVHEGQSIFVPKSALHRVENPGKVPLEIIEVQVGEYLGEDDIVRLEDIYGRLKEPEVFQLLQTHVKK